MSDLATALEHYNARRWAEAEAICTGILASRAANAQALHLMRAIAAQRGQVDQARQFLRQATQSDPDFADAWTDLARLLTLAGRESETLECWQAIARIRPEPALLITIANEHLKRGQFYHAEKASRQALQLNPNLAEAHLNLGAALHQQHRATEALESYQRAIAINPRMGVAYSNLADALCHLGRLDEAESVARKAIEIDPNSATAWNNLSTVLLLRGQDEE